MADGVRDNAATLRVVLENALPRTIWSSTGTPPTPKEGLAALDELEREITTLVRERDEAVGNLRMSGDAHNEVRIVLAEIGCEAAFVDDAARMAVAKVRELEAERERARTVRDALVIYDIWADAMPDAGFTDSDPRWNWWHKRPYEKAREALAATADPSTATGHRE